MHRIANPARRYCFPALFAFLCTLDTFGQEVCPPIVMVPMSDGTLLRTRINYPEGAGPWPVIMSRTPYWDADLCWNNNLGLWNYGYVVVQQNTRGRFGSEGEDLVFVNDAWGEHRDGYDSIQWLIEQPWCNGVVGLSAGSMRGAVVNLNAGSGHPNLFGEWIPRAPADFYQNGVLYYGGALRWDEFRYMQSQFGPLWASKILEHPAMDAFWEGLDVTRRQEMRNHPAIIWAGWYDSFLQSCLNNYISLRRDGGPIARQYSKLIVALTAHGTPGGDVSWPAEGAQPGIDYGRPLFDHFLKGEGNFGDVVPRVVYYVMGDFEDSEAPGNEWRVADDWPVPADDVPIYLHGDHTLRFTAPRVEHDSLTYAFDPANPVPTLGGAGHESTAVPGMRTGSLDQRSLEERPDVLVFETGPLPVPVEVVGKLWAHVWASSDCVDTDFTAKLTDVYPDGKSIILVDGIVRARARDSLANHQLMTPGSVYAFTIDLWSTAMVFNTGHRIRLAISSSNFPRFTVNPNTGAELALEYAETRIANNTLYFDASHPSHVILPIAGPDSDGDGVADWPDAFPWNAAEQADSDGDGMGDAFEQSIIDADSEDTIESFEDVMPHEDFDGDGNSNLQEFQNGTDPLDPESLLGLSLYSAIIATVLLGNLGRVSLKAFSHGASNSSRVRC